VTVSGRWTAPLRPAAAACSGRVVAFPHAGAGPQALLPVLRHLPRRLEAVGVTLPGREGRFGERAARLASDPGAVVAAVHAELAALPAVPTVVFGHSLGATLAAAVVAAHPGRYAGAVLSALPGAGSAAQRAGRWTDAQLLVILARGGATPDAIVTSPMWRRHLLDLLRADLTLGVRLAVGLDLAALDVPITLLAGADDDIAERSEVPVPTRERTFRGGHFYLFDGSVPADVAAEIVAAVPHDRARAARPHVQHSARRPHDPVPATVGNAGHTVNRCAMDTVKARQQ
jgi:surfactin synthase thioesterase subunit